MALKQEDIFKEQAKEQQKRKPVFVSLMLAKQKSRQKKLVGTKKPLDRREKISHYRTTGETREKFPESKEIRSRDKAANGLGKSGKQLKKISKVYHGAPPDIQKQWGIERNKIVLLPFPFPHVFSLMYLD